MVNQRQRHIDVSQAKTRTSWTVELSNWKDFLGSTEKKQQAMLVTLCVSRSPNFGKSQNDMATCVINGTVVLEQRNSSTIKSPQLFDTILRIMVYSHIFPISDRFLLQNILESIPFQASYKNYIRKREERSTNKKCRLQAIRHLGGDTTKDMYGHSFNFCILTRITVLFFKFGTEWRSWFIYGFQRELSAWPFWAQFVHGLNDIYTSP